MGYKSQLPTVNEVGKSLEDSGMVAFGRNAYNQTDNNCLAIASNLAEMFGYVPLSRQEVKDEFFEIQGNRVWGRPLSIGIKEPSPAYLVVRRPDNPNDVHISIELYGKEYNFGPGTKEGFPVDMRIPLHKQ